MITLGIDIGSTTSKCVLMKDGQEIIAASLRVGGLGTEGPAEALAELWEKSGLTADNVDRTIVTGYGRNKYEGADGEVSELTCHALGGRILRMDVDELDECASKSVKPASISSTCTVFAESEVISQLANGVERPDLVAGICESVASRVSALARRAGVVPKVCMSGGVAKNGAVRRALAKSLGTDIDFDPMAQYFGAIGAALYAYRQLSK